MGTGLTRVVEPVNFVATVVRGVFLVLLSFVVGCVSSDPLAVSFVYLIIVLDLQNELPLTNNCLDVGLNHLAHGLLNHRAG